MVLLTPVLAMGQFVTGGDVGTGKPWESFKLNPKTKVKLDFHNSGIDAILSKYQSLSGVTIVKDPNLTKGLTLTSAKPVSLGEAFQILQSTLNLQGYEIGKDSNLLIIRPKPKNQGGFGGMGAPGAGTFDPSVFMGGGDQPTPQLKVYPIKYANASQLARVLNDVFQSSGAGGFPFGGGGARPGGGGFQFGGNRGGGAAAFNPAMLAGRFGQQQTPQVRASSDDFSNSVIVNAPRDQQAQVAELIGQLDKITDEPQQTKVFPLEFAAAEDLQPVVQNLLNANVPRGKGGATTQQSQGPGAFFSAIRGSVSGSGQATADPRTNALIVTATSDNIKLVDKVVKELDTKIDLQPTTFVFPLSNAQSDDVAGLLNQAFGQRQGTGTNRGTTNNRNNGSSSTNRNNSNSNTRNRGNTGQLGGENVDPNEGDANSIPIDIDPNSDDGQLMTSIGVAQGIGQFFGGGGQTGQRRSTTGQSTSRDQNGKVVNANDLTGQVTTISDPNTNSIIVVTSPENAELIRRILDQLDKIPEQVMIQTIITEASLDAQDKLGVEWKFAQSKFLGNSSTTTNGNTNFGLQSGSTSATPLTGFSYTITGGNLSFFLNALQQDQKFQILSTPRIFTSNNVQAEINISQRVPYIVSSRQDVNGNFTYNYAFEDVGIVLTVTPHVTKDGYVTMDVSQTANDLQGYTTFNAPIINQRTAQTTVSVKNGETIVLGGIIRTTVSSTVSKVPLLGDIPILGKLFQNKSKEKQKTELLVFLTPRIVKDPDEAKKLREDTQKELSPETTKSLGGILQPPAGTVPPDGKGDKKTGGN